MYEQELEILHKNPKWSISDEEFLPMRKELPPEYSFTDVVWRVFNNKILRTDPRMSWGPLRCIYLNMGDAIYKLERNTSRAVPYWFCTLLFDMNCFVGEVLMHKTMGLPLSDLPVDMIGEEPYILPYLVKQLRRDPDRVRAINLEKTLKPPYSSWIYSTDDYRAILQAIIEEEPFQFEKWNKLCAQRTTEFISSLTKA